MKAILVLLGVTAALTLRSEPSQVSRQVFQDDARLAVIDQATRVEACILQVVDPSHGQDFNRRTYREGEYRALPEAVRTLIIWKLLDDRSYTWDALPACLPTYNARVRFVSDSRTVEIDFCFSCSQLLVREQGTPVGTGYFYPGSDWVFRALATQFPKDPVIRQRQKQREQDEAYRLEIEMAKAGYARKAGTGEVSAPAPAEQPRN